MKKRLLAGLASIAGICTIIGGLDLTQILPLVPDHVAAWLVLALPGAITAGKIATVLGDIADDGVRNDSFRCLPGLLLVLTAALALVSCGTLSLTPEGCVHSDVERDGQAYAAETCLSPDGRIDRVRLFWVNDTGRHLRATIFRDDRPVEIEFRELGIWYRWTEGMGLSLGTVPSEVAAALEAPPAAPVSEE